LSEFFVLTSFAVSSKLPACPAIRVVGGLLIVTATYFGICDIPETAGPADSPCGFPEPVFFWPAHAGKAVITIRTIVKIKVHFEFFINTTSIYSVKHDVVTPIPEKTLCQ
jgi:hypothetical protein